MVDLNAVERALLVNIVKNQTWETLVLNDITIDYFSEANKPMYNYIKQYTDTKTYPDIQLMSYTFQITDDELGSYLAIHDLQGLCDVIKTEFLKDELKYQLTQLNNQKDNIFKDPALYINSIGTVYNNLKVLSFKNRSFDLFDNIEEVLQIDPNDVISTGFPELDDKLIGWKRGEELVTIVGRPGQR